MKTYDYDNDITRTSCTLGTIHSLPRFWENILCVGLPQGWFHNPEKPPSCVALIEGRLHRNRLSVGPLINSKHLLWLDNTMSSEQNGGHIADDNFKCVSLNGCLKLKCHLNGVIYKKSALVQIMPRCRLVISHYLEWYPISMLFHDLT